MRLDRHITEDQPLLHRPQTHQAPFALEQVEHTAALPTALFVVATVVVAVVADLRDRLAEPSVPPAVPTRRYDRGRGHPGAADREHL